MKYLALFATLLCLTTTTSFSQIQIQVQLWEVSQAKALEIIDSAKGQKDVGKLVDTLKEQLAAGGEEVKLLSLPSITCRSGQRARVSSGSRNYVSSYKATPDGSSEVPVESRATLGTELEVDPVLSVDGKTVAITFGFTHALEAPEFHPFTIKGPVTGQDLTVEKAQEKSAVLTSALTIQNGETHFLGTIPHNNGGTTLLLVFLNAAIQE